MNYQQDYVVMVDNVMKDINVKQDIIFINHLHNLV